MRPWVLLLTLGACGRLGFDEVGGLGDDGPGPLPRVAVFSGGRSTCSIVDGLVSCWGDGRYGQLGDGQTLPRPKPARAFALDGAISFDVSDHHACAVRADGKVWCWGVNQESELGDPGTARTVPTTTVALPRPALQVTVGDYHSCALLDDGDIYCWGKNYLGQLGTGVVETEIRPPSRALIDDAVEVSAGQWTTCARKANGEVWCWGENYSGQVGIGSEAAGIGTPTRLEGLVATQISVGENAACALEAGHFRCWGNYRQLGREDVTDNSRPQPPSELGGLVSISVGGDGTCATADDGRAYCWGADAFGLLGNGAPFADNYNPQLVTASGLSHVSLGYFHACAVQGNDIACWGRGSYGQLGDDRDLGGTPVKTALSGMLEVDVGQGFACAQSQTKVFCWGADEHAQLADGGGDPRPTAVEIPLPQPVTGLTVGNAHACVTTGALGPRCWGANYSGQLGVGNTDFQAGPVSPPIASKQLSAGDSFTCGVTSTNTVQCWGRNADGQLGDGTQMERTGPTTLSGLSAITDIAVGGSHACAVDGASTWCWGSNYDGELGVGDISAHLSPTKLTTAPAFGTIAAAAFHTCGLDAAGVLFCWGAYVGGSATTPTSTPLQGKRFAVGGSSACLINSADQLACAGRNDSGQLGDHTYTATPTPVAVVEVGAVRSVSIGDDLGCAVTLGAGDVWCWGNNDRGQLGRGTMTSAPAPVPVTP